MSKKKPQSERFAARRSRALEEIEAIAKRAADENRELTPEEVSQRDALVAKAEKAEQRAFDARVDETLAKREVAANARNDLGIGNAPANSPGGSVKVRSSERTYRKGDPTVNYMTDLVAAVNPLNRSAIERLHRHAAEVAVDAEEARNRINAGSPKQWDDYFVRQVRTGMAAAGVPEFQARTGDLSTAAGAGGEFVPPAYLTAEYVPYARAGRVFADACNKQDLPPGTMSINIPKVSGGTTTDTQGTGNPRTQNVAISDTALQTEYVTFPVVTVAGGQTLSLQLLERSPIPFDDVTFKDLHLALAVSIDSKCINGAGSGDIEGAIGTSGVNSVTFNTGGTDFITGLFGSMAEAKAKIAHARFLPATHAFFTPDRWASIEQLLDKNDRPLVGIAQNGAFANVQVAPDAAVAQGNTGGRMLSLDVLQDYNVPADLGTSTNQDAIIVAKMDDLYLYESPVVARALPQTYGNQLTVLLQVYEYAAFTAARYPTSVSYITGTELTNPISFQR